MTGRMARWLLSLWMVLIAGPALTQTPVLTTGDIVAVDQVVVASVRGVPAATITLSGTWTGTITVRHDPGSGACGSALLVAVVGSAATATSATANGTWSVNNAGFDRICATATAAMTGTASVRITQGALSSTSALGLAGDTELPAAAALADGASATPTTVTVGAVPFLMNATTLDRARAVVAALDSTGTGIAAAGLVAQLDDTATAVVTENQFAPLRVDSSRRLLVDLSGSSLTALQLIDDVVFNEDDPAVNAEQGIIPLFVRRDTTPSSSCGLAGDLCWPNIDANGRIYTNTVLYGADGTALTSGDVTFGTTTYTETTSTGPGAAVRNDTPDSLVGTTNEFGPLGLNQNGALWTSTIDPCSYLAKTPYVVNISTATTTEITGSLAGASNNYYVCSINLVTAAANNVAIVDDDTDGCVSVTSGLAGGTTAASGWNFAANGGIPLGNGDATVLKTNGTNRVLCLVTSAATQLSGTILAVAAP